MRMFGIYYICKNYIDIIENMKLISKKDPNGKNVQGIEDWQEKSEILNELSKIEPLREKVKAMYNCISVINRDENEFDLSPGKCEQFRNARSVLFITMQSIIELYETINTKEYQKENIGFDIKLPQFSDLGEFSRCLEDLDFMIKQCPYLSAEDAQIKYGSVDIGSAWVTFLIVGATSTVLLANLSKLVDTAIKIKSHITTVKMQEEMLRSIEIKTEIAGEVLDAFHKTNKAIVNDCIDGLQKELGDLENGEERDKVGRSLEKLAYWMDKGMQIYSTIDASQEIKDLFPVQDDLTHLTDNIQKLIDMNVSK